MNEADDFRNATAPRARQSRPAAARPDKWLPEARGKRSIVQFPSPRTMMPGPVERTVEPAHQVRSSRSRSKPLQTGRRPSSHAGETNDQEISRSKVKS